MREGPTLRIPFGILLLLAALCLYVMGVVWASQWIERLHVIGQTIVYLILGIIWLLPLRRYLIWMETGRWR